MAMVNTGQMVFNPRVQSLSVSNPYDFMAPPVIKLTTNDVLDVNFDLIGEEREYLRYRIIHCNSDWQPSRLMESEFVNGFNETLIEDYGFSRDTYIHYVNYNITLPDQENQILVSGNYLLQVYPEGYPDDILFQVRFSVTEDISPINGGITSRTDKGTDSYYQQLFFNVDLGALGNVNPYQDLIINIEQNNSPFASKTISHPMRVTGGKAVFEHSPELIFEASNEYRRFETVRTDYPGMRVDSVKFMGDMWHAWVHPDESRVDRQYFYDKTQHGRFKIDDYNGTEPDLSADYVMVHFTLEPVEHVKGNIFIDGDFTNHILNDMTMMKYDWNDGLYHTSIPLKQGSYNYRYIVLPEDGSIPSPSSIEGNKYETNNEYLIKVFLRTPGSRSDRLVGVSKIES